MTHPYDDIEPTAQGRYAKWIAAGDTVEGTIAAVTVGRAMPAPGETEGRKIPQLTVTTRDGDVIVSASQAALRNKLLELQPEIGQQIRIKYTGEQRLEGGRTMKTFEVTINAAPAPDDEDPF